MTSELRRAFVGCMALLLALAAVGGAVTLGHSDAAPEAVQDATNQIAPVGDAEAGAVTVGVVIGTFAAAQYACDKGYICDSPSAEEMAEVDALETKTSIHEQALQQSQNNENWHQQVSNELQDTKSIARMEAKNAYIKALNNGTAEAIARSRARQAVSDYYSVRQKMMISQWETSLATFDSMRFTAQNTTGIDHGTKDSDFVHIGQQYTIDSGGSSNEDVWIDYLGQQNKTTTFANGSSVTFTALDVHGKLKYGSQSPSTSKQWVIGPSTGPVSFTHDDEPTLTSRGLYVEAPNSNFNQVQMLNYSKWSSRWSKIQQYNNDVQAEIDTFVNQTYDSYQQGEISNSDLVDPYLGAREYDPQNSSSWALRSATAMGIAPPTDTGNVDTMTVTTDNTTVSGMLMTGGDHTIESGTAYNASNMTGPQYVWDPDTGQMTEITGEYTVSEITAPDGSTRDSVEYTDTDYGATSVEEYQQRMERLNNLTAQINARQQRLRQAAGSSNGNPLDDFGFGGLPGSVGAFVAVVLALLAVGIVTRS